MEEGLVSGLMNRGPGGERGRQPDSNKDQGDDRDGSGGRGRRSDRNGSDRSQG